MKVSRHDDIFCHLKLEDEWLEVARTNHQAYLAENYKFRFRKKKDFHANKSKGKKNCNIKP